MAEALSELESLEARAAAASETLRHEQIKRATAEDRANDAEQRYRGAHMRLEVAEANLDGAVVAKRQAQEGLLAEERKKQAADLQVKEQRTIIGRLKFELAAVRT